MPKFLPVCRLRLLETGSPEQPYGIDCIGFVSEVEVVLHGPWLNGAASDPFFNLPTWASFSFSFINAPGHSNAFGSFNPDVKGEQVLNSEEEDLKPQVGGRYLSAFAPDVLKYFYNSTGLNGLRRKPEAIAVGR